MARRFRRLIPLQTNNGKTKQIFIFLSSATFVLSLVLFVYTNMRVEKEVAGLPTISQWTWYSNTSEVFNEVENILRWKNPKVSINVGGLSEKLSKAEDELSVNPHNFKYMLNPGPMSCRSSGKPIFLVYVHSAPHHHSRRILIRETWASPFNFDDIEIRTIFMCGTTNNSNVQAALELEFDRYRDIVQENFVDSYRNLTYKAIMALQWVSNYCLNAKIVLKTDDDIFVNIFKLVPHLKNIMKQKDLLKESHDRTIVCNVWNQMKVVRDPTSKWFISKSEFPDDVFGTYCSGSAYAFTPGLARSMFVVSKDVPFFWVDDYYITGMLPAKLTGVVYESINKIYFLSSTAFFEKFGTGDGKLVFGHAHNINHWKQAWKLLLKRSKRNDDDYVPSSSPSSLSHKQLSLTNHHR